MKKLIGMIAIGLIAAAIVGCGAPATNDMPAQNGPTKTGNATLDNKIQADTSKMPKPGGG